MNEIRFSQPNRVDEYHPENKVETSKKSRNFLGSVAKIFLAFIVLILLFYFGFLAKDLISQKFVKKDQFSAVFLTNGQVYFGKMIENNKKEIILNNVYYLQINNPLTQTQVTEALNQTRFNLVKLGDELHGPTDELFINKDQVVFYEYLRDDSKVVESIKNLN